MWGLDDRTTIIIVDPTSPNILAFNTGRSVEQLLSRSFFIELQSRYGNKFFVRDEVNIIAACTADPYQQPSHIKQDRFFVASAHEGRLYTSSMQNASVLSHVLCCAALRCAVLCCAVLCCAVLCLSVHVMSAYTG